MFHEERLVVGRLISACSLVGINEQEMMQIVAQCEGSVESLLCDAGIPVWVERRVRRLHEFLQLLDQTCGMLSDAWLRQSCDVLGGRSPLETLIEIPAALEGFLTLLRLRNVPGFPCAGTV